MTFKWFTSFITGAALVGATLSSTLPASAEQAPDNNGPGVARVSVVQGDVVVQRGDSNTQTTAVVNGPLLPGDYLSTGGTSRAELQFDGETAVRLGGNVQARITDNDPNNRAVQLADGTVEVGIVHGDQPFQVDTPSVSVRSQDAGDYRVTVNRDGSTWVTARRGNAQVVTPDHTYDLSPGRTLVARGSASSPSISWRSEVGFDSFDDFNAKRDETMTTALNASPNLSPTIAGYDNLDQYGDWQDVAGYGQVWVPDEPADWAPYRDGSWAWEGGYGWTWVGAEPWGWAPYHYGRWFWANGYGWAWYPPAYSYAPVWAPALVGFYGWGGGVGIGVGFGGFGYGGIGWCPLAPFEAFYPWYPGWAWGGAGWGYGSYGGYRGWGTRVVNVTNIRNVYRNFGHGGGSGTLRGNFEHGNFSHNVAVTSQNAGKVGTIRGAVPVTPSRDNLGFGRTPNSPVAFSKAFDSPRFASNRALASRNSFAGQQRSVEGAIHANTGRESAPVTHETNTVQGRTESHTGEARTTEARTNEARTTETGTSEREPNQTWERFDESRGSSRENAASERSAQGERAPSTSEGSREERPASNSWSRYSNQRGSASVPVTYGDRDRGAYTHSSYPSYPSYSHSSYPSYSHSSYPSYSHSSYPSYSHSSYPSYSHSSYPSYSRGSAPSAPSYPHGSGGGSAPHSSGGGGGGHGGGGRPPH